MVANGDTGAEAPAAGAAPGDAAQTSGLFVSPVQIGPDALIHYIKEQAAEQAAASARERLSFFFSAVGLVVGLLTAAGAAALYTINRDAVARVQAEVAAQIVPVASALDNARGAFETSVTGRIDGLRADLDTRLAAQADAIATAQADLTTLLEARFGELSAEMRAGLRDEVSAVVLLPLLVSEATSLSSRTLQDRLLYASADRDRVIEALADLEPRIRELDGTAREIAFRRLEDVLDAFFTASDYGAALQVYDLFPDEILALRGTRLSMTVILSALLLLDRDAAETRRASVMAVLNAPYDRSDPTERMWVERLRIVQALRAGEDDATLAARVVEVEAAAPGFIAFMAQFLREQRSVFLPDGMQPSPFGLSNVDRIETALLAAQVP